MEPLVTPQLVSRHTERPRFYFVTATVNPADVMENVFIWNAQPQGLAYSSQFGLGPYGNGFTYVETSASGEAGIGESQSTYLIRQEAIVQWPTARTATFRNLLTVNAASFDPSEIFSFVTLKDEILLEPQEEGGFVAYSKEYPAAIGQGETEDEALRDLQEAIDLLKEVLEEDKKQK